MKSGKPWISEMIRGKLESSFWLVLLLQGIGGLVLLKAFVSLHGESYLRYNEFYISGVLAATLLILNLENLILSGSAGRSAAILLLVFSVFGIGSLVFEIMLRHPTPGILSFCCWSLSSRIILSMAAHRRINYLLVFPLGILTICSFFFLDLPGLLLFGFAVSIITSFNVAQECWDKHDPGIVRIISSSTVDYLKYLPHTLAGFSLGYLDRYLGLHILEKAESEQYLRSVQLCSMAAFICYPYAYYARNKLLRIGNTIKIKDILSSFIIILVAMLLLLVLLSITMSQSFAETKINILLMSAILLAFSLSLLYQIISPVIFVKKKFGIINRITIASAGVSILIAFSTLSLSRTAYSLAAVLFSGWLMQVLATSRFLVRGIPDEPRQGSLAGY